LVDSPASFGAPRSTALALSTRFVVCALCVSSCVVPVAPSFQDPPTAPNYSPYIISANPDFGAIVATSTPMFSVTVTDPNVGDDLHVRWLADYPSTTGSYRTLVPDFFIAHAADGQPLHATSSFTIDCAVDNLAMTSDGQHRIEAIVADRGFVPNPPNNQLDAVTDDGLVARAFWLVQKACASQ
jgi:hypothetical protein